MFVFVHIQGNHSTHVAWTKSTLAHLYLTTQVLVPKFTKKISDKEREHQFAFCWRKFRPSIHGIWIRMESNNYLIRSLKLTLEGDLIDLAICAALSAKTIKNAFLAQHHPWTRHGTRYHSGFCFRNTRSMHSFQECRLSVADSSAKWLNTTTTPWTSFNKQAVSCNGVF